MDILRVSNRQKKLLIASLVNRLEYWRATLIAAESPRDDKLREAALGYITEYLDLLSALPASPENTSGSRPVAHDQGRTSRSAPGAGPL